MANWPQFAASRRGRCLFFRKLPAQASHYVYFISVFIVHKWQLSIRITPVSIKYDLGLEENEPTVIFDRVQIFSNFHNTFFYAYSLAAVQKYLFCAVLQSGMCQPSNKHSKTLQNIKRSKWCKEQLPDTELWSQALFHYQSQALLHYLQDLPITVLRSPLEKRLLFIQVQTETLMVLKNSKISQHSAARCPEREGLACPGHPAWLVSGWRISIPHALGCSGHSKPLQFITPRSHEAFSVNSLLCVSWEKYWELCWLLFYEPGHCKSWQRL